MVKSDPTQSNVQLSEQHSVVRKAGFSEEEKAEIIRLYVEENRGLDHLANQFHCSGVTINKWLRKWEIPTKKKGFSEEEKAEIIRLYVEEHRGKEYIGGRYNCSDATIAYWLKKWDIPNNSRSIICKKLREVYGPTRGFSGKKHSHIAKCGISKGGKRAWAAGLREVAIGNSRTYLTSIGKVLGRYEVAYVQECLDAGIPLEVCRKRYKTPYGTYRPDFVQGDKFIEIKSEFTLRVAQGIYADSDGHRTDNQWKKISYFKNHIGRLEVVVIAQSKALGLFKKAQDNGVLIKHAS